MVRCMFIIEFSDGRRIPVKASCEEAARNAAYRIERVHAITSIEAY